MGFCKSKIGSSHPPIAGFLYLGLFLILLVGFWHCGSTPKKSVNATLDRKPPEPIVGKVFHYRHIGPRPWGDGRMDATGGRSVAVTGTVKPKNNLLWSIEEQFENSEGVQVGYYDADYRLNHQILHSQNGDLQVEFTPPLHVRHLNLQSGEEKSMDCKQTLTDMTNKQVIGVTKMNIKTKREHDERIITPAGAYMCRHFVSRISIEASIDEKTITFSGTEEMYWCDMLIWFVKETLVFDPLLENGQIIRPGYKTESLLIGME